MRGILCTSLTPDRIDLQQQAVDSWRDAGFDPVSVNCREEVDVLKRTLTGVDFIAIRRDARHLHKKPLVYFDEIISAMVKCSSPIVGVINSDIVLRAPGLKKKLQTSIKNQLFFSSRIDVPEITQSAGRVYELGFDFFVFDASLLKKIPKSSFCMGVPWWDYWLPIAAMIAGYRCVQIDPGLVFHQTHPVQYENENFYRYGRHIHYLLREQMQNGRGISIKQSLEKFIGCHFKGDVRKQQDALYGVNFQRFENNASLPSFAEAVCAFIKHFSDKYAAF